MWFYYFNCIIGLYIYILLKLFLWHEALMGNFCLSLSSWLLLLLFLFFYLWLRGATLSTQYELIFILFIMLTLTIFFLEFFLTHLFTASLVMPKWEMGIIGNFQDFITFCSLIWSLRGSCGVRRCEVTKEFCFLVAFFFSLISINVRLKQLQTSTYWNTLQQSKRTTRLMFADTERCARYIVQKRIM